MTARIVVQLHESGKLEIRGNVRLDQQLGILEMAKFALLQQLSRPNQPALETPTDDNPAGANITAVGLARSVAPVGG